MTTSSDRTAHRAVIGAVLFGALWLPWVPARVLAMFFAAGVVPGLALTSRSRLRFEGALGAGTSLSPVIFTVLVLAGLLAGLGIREAALVASAFGLALFVVLGNGVHRMEDADRRALAWVVVVTLTAAALAFTLPLADAWWRVRDDSWFHAAVADKLMRDGLPLHDPYFAGLRIQYMYAYHALVAACASLTSIDFFRAMILVNAMALLATALAFYALAGEFSRRVAPRVLGVLLLVFGTNGWFFLSYPLRVARALFGQTHGLETLRSMVPWTPPGHATAIGLLSVEGNQFMFLDKFMLGTAVSLTFGLLATLLLLLVRARRGEWSARHDIAFVLATGGAILLHSVIGLASAVATAVVLAFLLVIRSQPSPGGPSYARLLAWTLLAVALVGPYIVSAMPRGGESAVAFALQGSQAVGIFFGVLPALALTVVFLRGASHDTGTVLGSRPFAELSLSATGVVMGWTLAAAMIALTVDLVTNNETKFVFVLVIPLAALAVGGIERLWESRRGRRAAILLVASATLPLNVVYFAHAFRDASTFDVSDSERAVYGWLKKNAPGDVVVIDASDNVRVPVLASRDLYWGTETYARNWSYPGDEIAARRRVRDATYSREGLSQADLIGLRALQRPVFVVYRSQPDDLFDAHERFEHESQLHGRFATPDIAVWEVELDE